MTNQLQHQERRAVDLRIPAIEKYAYCLCLHVKPTTIFIAVFKLIRALLFASILLNTEFSINEPGSELGLSLDDRHRSTAAAVNILTRIIMASVSAVGIYAVISGRAALLMPLYAILLVDFFFALPAFYNRDLDPSLSDSFDFRSYSPGANQYTRYSLMLFSTLTMIVKIYFLCVIWKCYRYLRLIELVSPIGLSDIYPHIHVNGPHQYPIVRVLGSSDSNELGIGHNLAPPPYESIASNMKPPNYEEAMKSPTINPPVSPTISQQTMVINNPIVEQVVTDANIRSMENVITGLEVNDVSLGGPSATDTVDSCLSAHDMPSGVGNHVVGAENSNDFLSDRTIVNNILKAETDTKDTRDTN